MSSPAGAGLTGMTKVQWQFTASLDGFMAGPEHDMSFLGAVAADPDEPDPSVAALAAETGALFMGNGTFRGNDPLGKPVEGEAYDGSWHGPQYVLTHHPIEAAGYTMVRDVADGVAQAIEGAKGKNVGILGADLGRQCLEAGLLDEIWISFVPVLLGDGTRVYDVAGGALRRLERIGLWHTSIEVGLLLRVPKEG